MRTAESAWQAWIPRFFLCIVYGAVCSLGRGRVVAEAVRSPAKAGSL